MVVDINSGQCMLTKLVSVPQESPNMESSAIMFAHGGRDGSVQLCASEVGGGVM